MERDSLQYCSGDPPGTGPCGNDKEESAEIDRCARCTLEKSWKIVVHAAAVRSSEEKTLSMMR